MWGVLLDKIIWEFQYQIMYLLEVNTVNEAESDSEQLQTMVGIYIP